MVSPRTSETGFSPTFADLGVHPDIVRALAERNIVNPTPIQERVIPSALLGNDIIGGAQTGTGKTLAFGIPILQQMMGNNDKALVILPTRELAQQVEQMLNVIAKEIKIQIALLIGGVPKNMQIATLRQSEIRLFVGTPGRLKDFLQAKVLTLEGVTKVALDEGDQMLDMGFEPDVKNILSHVQRDRQTMLFSATIDGTVSELAASMMRKDAQRIEVAPSGTAAENVEQQLLFAHGGLGKFQLLERLLAKHRGSSIIVFRNRKYDVARLANGLKNLGYKAVEFSKDCSQSDREDAWQGFLSRKYLILVASDVAGRGLDSIVDVVINYDVPTVANTYVHRIGRTGRADRSGIAYTLAIRDKIDAQNLAEIERLIGKQIPRDPQHS